MLASVRSTGHAHTGDNGAAPGVDDGLAGAIVKTPGVCGGAARLRGRRVPVWLLADWRKQGHSAVEVLEFLPDLSLEEVAAAWDYYDAHRSEVDGEIRRNEDA